MQRHFLLLMITHAFSLAPTLVKGQEQAEHTVLSEIKNVTVYLSGAQVTRTATVDLRKGSQRLLLKELSEEVDPNSVQVSGTGNFTILSVKHRMDHGAEQEEVPVVTELEQEIRRLERNIQDEQISIGILQNEEARLQKNETIEAGEGGMSLDQLRSINDYVRERIGVIRTGIVQRQRHMDELKDQAQKAHLQIGQLRSRKPRAKSEVLMELAVPEAIKSTITLQYVVRSAGWSPLYDIRVGSLSAPMDLTYKASVHQSTGENWENVGLELSSGDPQQNGVMPIMSVWRLDAGSLPPTAQRAPRPFNASIREVRGIIRDANTGEPLPFVNIAVESSDGTAMNGTTSSFDGYYALAIPPGGRKIIYSFAGYGTLQKEIHDNTMNVALDQQELELSEFEVVHYNVPLIDRDGGASGEVIREDIKNMAGRTAASIETTMAGVVNDNPVRGARTEWDHYYVDGIKVMEGGVPANYGDGRINGPGTVVHQRNTQFAFQIALPYTIPSDGKGHVVAVKDHQVQSVYRHYSIPKLDPSAYLFAKAIGWDHLDLLPGPVNLYYEGTFIGETFLDSDQVTDTLDISLGRDRSIVVQRTRSRDLSRQQFIGNKRIETIGWDLEVRNTKSEAIDMVIMDQIPVPVRKEIEVSLENNDASNVEQDKGILTWRLAIPSHTTEKYGFLYTVRAHRNMPLILE